MDWLARYAIFLLYVLGIPSAFLLFLRGVLSGWQDASERFPGVLQYVLLMYAALLALGVIARLGQFFFFKSGSR